MRAYASATHANIDPIDVLLEIPFKSLKEDRMTVYVKFQPAVMEFVKAVWAQYTTVGIDIAPEAKTGNYFRPMLGHIHPCYGLVMIRSRKCL